MPGARGLGPGAKAQGPGPRPGARGWGPGPKLGVLETLCSQSAQESSQQEFGWLAGQPSGYHPILGLGCLWGDKFLFQPAKGAPGPGPGPRALDPGPRAPGPGRIKT